MSKIYTANLARVCVYKHTHIYMDTHTSNCAHTHMLENFKEVTESKGLKYFSISFRYD